MKHRFDSNRGLSVLNRIYSGLIIGGTVWFFAYLTHFPEDSSFTVFFVRLLVFLVGFFGGILAFKIGNDSNVSESRRKYAEKAFDHQLNGSFGSQVEKVIRDLRKKNRVFPNQVKILLSEVHNLLALSICSDMDPKEAEKSIMAVTRVVEAKNFGNHLPDPPVYIVFNDNDCADVWINGECVNDQN
jgi:hypothetical protein